MIPKPIWVSAALGALAASLCCLGPLILASLGLVSIPLASRLADRMFFGYWWLFVGGGFTIASIGMLVFRRQIAEGCAADPNVRRRLRLRNLFGLTLLLFAITYII